MKPLRILVADDHEIVRRGLVDLLKSHAGWEVCGEAHDGREAVDMANKLKPDIVILDIHMPNLNGLEAARQMLFGNSLSKVLILTIEDSDELVRAVLNAGARGFVLKSDATRDLVAAVEALQSNKTFFTSRVAEMVLGGHLGHSGPAVSRRQERQGGGLSSRNNGYVHRPAVLKRPHGKHSTSWSGTATGIGPRISR